MSQGDGSFSYQPQTVVPNFGYEAGGWRVDKHIRLLADLRGLGRADIVGFGDAGVMIDPEQRRWLVRRAAAFRDSELRLRRQRPSRTAGAVPARKRRGHRSGVRGPHRDRLLSWRRQREPAVEVEGRYDGMAAACPGWRCGCRAPLFREPLRAQHDLSPGSQHVMRSDDGGSTWQIDQDLEQQLTCGGRIPVTRNEDDDGMGDHLDVVLTDMQFDRLDPNHRFAVGLGGAFMTRDGASWERLLDTGALRGRLSNCYLDWIDTVRPHAVRLVCGAGHREDQRAVSLSARVSASLYSRRAAASAGCRRSRPSVHRRASPGHDRRAAPACAPVPRSSQRSAAVVLVVPRDQR